MDDLCEVDCHCIIVVAKCGSHHVQHLFTPEENGTTQTWDNVHYSFDSVNMRHLIHCKIISSIPVRVQAKLSKLRVCLCLHFVNVVIKEDDHRQFSKLHAVKLVILITEVVVFVTIVLLRFIRSAVKALDLGLFFVDLKLSVTVARIANDVELHCELFHGTLDLFEGVVIVSNGIDRAW